MSKRKSRTKSMYIDKSDMVFEDDSEPELLMAENGKAKNKKVNAQTSNDSASTRVSSRAKKTKSIYDPSEYNGPVHKKKREALEAANLKKQQKTATVPPPSSASSSSPTKIAPKTPVKQQVKTPTKSQIKPTTVQAEQLVKIQGTERLKQIAVDFNKKKDHSASVTAPQPIIKIAKPVHQATANEPSLGTTSTPVSPSKSSKRKETLVPRIDFDAQPTTSSRARARSPSTSGNSEFEKASTVDLNDRKIPDVSKWTSSDVYNHFIRQGFEEKDARTFKDQEIDGETLMIMRREDLRSLNLRVGVFVKMWKRILEFQSGSTDISQGWK